MVCVSCRSHGLALGHVGGQSLAAVWRGAAPMADAPPGHAPPGAIAGLQAGRLLLLGPQLSRSELLPGVHHHRGIIIVRHASIRIECKIGFLYRRACPRILNAEA